MKQIRLGGLSIDQTAALAPMASVGDRAYRLMCKRYGAAYVVGEMASAKALCYSDRKSAELLESTPEEQPMAIQLFGSEPDFMARAVRIAEKYHPQVIDVNMGCPVPKVAGNGCGSALMKTPELACEIIRAMCRETDIPVTVKIRTGWDADSINAPELARGLEEAGAAAITVHGRTKQQMYRPGIDFDTIRAVKESVSIPVIGNGGITSGPEAVEMYQRTGCDLVMIGQGSYGRPWIFEEVRQYLETGEILPEKPLEERLEIMLEHLSLICAFKGEKMGMMEGRKHAAWYIKGARGAAGFRHACGQLSHYEDLKLLVNEVLRASREAE